MLVGTEEVYGTRIFERHTYFPRDIRFGFHFSRMLEEAKVRARMASSPPSSLTSSPPPSPS